MKHFLALLVLLPLLSTMQGKVHLVNYFNSQSSETLRICPTPPACRVGIPNACPAPIDSECVLDSTSIVGFEQPLEQPLEWFESIIFSDSTDDPTPGVTDEPSPITDDPSPITDDPSPITDDPSPITDDPSPITDDPSPITDDPSPITDDPSPITDDPSPITTTGPTPTTGGPTPTITDGPTPTITNGPTPTITDGPTPTITGGPTPTITDGPTPTITDGPTPTITSGPTPTITDGPTPTITDGPTPTITDGPTPTITSGPTPTVTDGPTPTITDGPTPTITDGPTPTITSGPTPTITDGPTPTVTDGPTPTITDGPTPTITDGPTPTITSGPTPTITDGPTPTVTDGPTPTVTDGPTPTIEPTTTPSPIGTCQCPTENYFLECSLNRCVPFSPVITGSICQLPQHCVLASFENLINYVDCILDPDLPDKTYSTCSCKEDTAVRIPANDKCYPITSAIGGRCDFVEQCKNFDPNLDNVECVAEAGSPTKTCQCVNDATEIGGQCWPVRYGEHETCQHPDQCTAGMGDLANCTTGVCLCSGTSKYYDGDEDDKCFLPRALRQICDQDGQCAVGAGGPNSECDDATPTRPICQCKEPENSIEFENYCYLRKRVGDNCTSHAECEVPIAGSRCNVNSLECECQIGFVPDFQGSVCRAGSGRLEVSFALVMVAVVKVFSFK